MGYTVKKHTFKDGKVMFEYRIAYANGEYVSLDDYEIAMQKKREEIEDLRKRLRESKDYITQFKHDLEKKDNIQKINLNEIIKVKLTPYGAEIYYKQFDELNKQYGRQICKPLMPRIDKDGYTEFQLWQFIELYGKHIGMCKPKFIEPLEIVYCKHNREDEE